MSPKLLKGKYADLKNSAAIHAALAKDGYKIFSWSDRPGAYYSKHSHPHDEYIVVESGQIIFLIQEQSYPLEKGDALILPAGTVHEAKNSSTDNVSYFICTRQ
ncbi:MAG TPA: cupin domain-containing protein [Oculatellaceae cyanobacterium]